MTDHRKETIFLATTALADFWDQSKEILFLSQACLRFSKRKEWASLTYKLLPDPWTDPVRNEAAVDLCNKLYERMLKDLTVYLNRIHKTDYSERYWRIVVGEWLWRYIQIIFERYASLKEAIKTAGDFETIWLDKTCYRFVKNNLEFANFCTSDIFNLQIYSQILNGLGYQGPTRKCGGALSRLETEDVSWIDPFKDMAKAVILDGKLAAARFTPGDICFSGVHLPSYLHIHSMHGLVMRSKNLNLGVEITNPSPDKQKRSALAQTKGETEFETICYELMEYCFPLVYLEGYKKLARQVNYFGKPPRVILSSVTWRFETLSAIYIAQSVERGSRLIGIQHGGGYGTYAIDSMLDHEVEAVDAFFSWGWDDSNKKIVSLPQPALSWEKNKPELEVEPKGILYVGAGNPRYQSIFQSSPWGIHAEEYFQARSRFFASLSQRMKSLMLVRLYYLDFGWDGRERLMEQEPSLEYDLGEMTFIERAKRCKLVVADGNHTAYLQSIALDVPTVIYWDPKVWRMRKSAQPYFDQLRKAGVLYDSPDSAAFFVNVNYDSIQEWWNSVKVMDAVHGFRSHYANVSEKWELFWENSIKRELNKYEVAHG